MSRLLLVAGWVRRRLWLFALLCSLVAALPGEGLPPDPLESGIEAIVSDIRFNFVGWGIDAIWSKFTHWLIQPQRYVAEQQRSALVREYLDLVARIQELERQITTIYADPNTPNPEVAAAGLLEELTLVRAAASDRQFAAESIIEEQVGLLLAENDLDLTVSPFPPVGLRLTPPPYLLIVSPRERIETIHQEELIHGLNTAQHQTIEEDVDRLDVSSLVVGIGGMSAWPAMVQEWPSLNWLVEVTAHEWTHHYLALSPLGWEYNRRQETRTINETTSSIVGGEIGLAVLERYYPDLVPQPEESTTSELVEPQPPVFDFRAEMHRTRVEVDRLLEAGLVAEAEAYMEERRQFFWENGHRIRKLNQAYFAFYGSYADHPGATGDDPIGPAVWELRRSSSGLAEFLDLVSDITTLEQLRAAVENAD